MSREVTNIAGRAWIRSICFTSLALNNSSCQSSCKQNVMNIVKKICYLQKLEETYRSINSLSMLYAKSISSSTFANPIFFPQTKLAIITLKRHTLFLIPWRPDLYLWSPTTPLRGSFPGWTHCEVDNFPAVWDTTVLRQIKTELKWNHLLPTSTSSKERTASNWSNIVSHVWASFSINELATWASSF